MANSEELLKRCVDRNCVSEVKPHLQQLCFRLQSTLAVSTMKSLSLLSKRWMQLMTSYMQQKVLTSQLLELLHVCDAACILLVTCLAVTSNLSYVYIY